MVERPIKKSERQDAAPAGDVVKKVLDREPNRTESNPEQVLTANTQFKGERGQKRQDDKGRKQSRGSRQKSRETSPVNPALLRGPKPAKPKPAITHAEEATSAESPLLDEEQNTPIES